MTGSAAVGAHTPYVRPYDGNTYRYSHSDEDQSDGLRIVQRMLGGDVGEAQYAISMYSGGMGIFDKFAISFAAERIAEVVARLGFVAAGEIAWFTEEREASPEAEAAAHLTDERNKDFQPECTEYDPIWFEPDSGVNHWAALWLGSDQRAHYLFFDQG